MERHQQALAGCSARCYGLCAQAGLAKVGMVAVDGTKVQANASRNEKLDYEQIAREILEEAMAIDEAEDELYGDSRGDELPPELDNAQGRKKWLRAWKRSWMINAQRTRNRCRANAPSASRRPSAASKRSSGPSPRQRGL